MLSIHPHKNSNNAPLVVFRIFLGFLLACECFGAIITGWVKRVLIDTEFTFNFIGFDFLQILVGSPILYFYFALMGLLGLLIMLGFHYRKAIIGFTILWAGVYFMQKSSYNNHYYLLLLICFYMIFLPANARASIDSKSNKRICTNVMPLWISYLFIVQVAIVYFYATIAKFYPDWLNGTFTKNLLDGRTSIPWIQNIFSQKWFYFFIAYSGILYDMLIVPLLLSKRTRTIALFASLIFHLFNSFVLKIGIFPYFALSFSLFFYPSNRIDTLFLKKFESKNQNIYPSKTGSSKKLYYFFILVMIIQLLLPLRHYFIKGDVLWTEEGHRLSWRMMLRERSGFISFKIIDNTTKKEIPFSTIDLNPKDYNKLACYPDFIWQYCQRIKKKYKGMDISIYIDCKNSINKGNFKTFIDPNYDMSKAKWDYFFHNEWILLYE